MQFNLNPTFVYNKDNGSTICILKDTKNNTYTGVAQCHPADMDMENHLTGEEIAYRRAYINYLKMLRDTTVPKLEVLKHLYSCISQAANFNPKDNSVRLLIRAIEDYSAGVDMLRQAVRDERNMLHQYLTDKAKLYKQIRESRNNTAKNN